MTDNLPKENSNNEINVKDLIEAIFKKRFLVLLHIFLAGFLSVIFALWLPNVYSSKAILVPINSEDSIQSSLGNLSGITNLVGMNFSSGSEKIIKEAIANLRTFDFFKKDFLPYIDLANLMAIKEWDEVSNSIIYDSKKYNSKNDEWLRSSKKYKSSKPSDLEAFEEYLNSLIILEDKKTGFYKITINHKSPYIAKKWLDLIITKNDKSFRDRDIKEINDSINFLNEKFDEAKKDSLKNSITSLMEKQLQKLMLVSVSKFYVFRVIETPVVAEEKSAPNRALICILITMLGTLFSLIYVISSFYYKRS